MRDEHDIDSDTHRQKHSMVMRRRLTMELQRGLRFETLKRRLENGETFDEQ